MSGMTTGDGLNQLAAGLSFVAAGIAAAAFFLSVAQCHSAEQQGRAERYKACIYAIRSPQECGKP